MRVAVRLRRLPRLLSVSYSSKYSGLSNRLRGCKSRHGYQRVTAARAGHRGGPYPPTRGFSSGRSPSGRRVRFAPPPRYARWPWRRARGTRLRRFPRRCNSPAARNSNRSGRRTNHPTAARAGHRGGPYPPTRGFNSLSCDRSASGEATIDRASRAMGPFVCANERGVRLPPLRPDRSRQRNVQRKVTS